MDKKIENVIANYVGNNIRKVNPAGGYRLAKSIADEVEKAVNRIEWPSVLPAFNDEPWKVKEKEAEK